jgi:hypothetical protein
MLVRAMMVDVAEGLRIVSNYAPRPAVLQLTKVCSAGAGGSGMRGAIGEASMGRTNCASDLVLPVAEMGVADRARKDSSSWAVTRPAEGHVAPACFLLGNMPNAYVCVDTRTADVEVFGDGLGMFCRWSVHRCNRRNEKGKTA